MTLWHYLTLVNIYLVLFYGFYAAILKRTTFFQLNRIYLMAAVIFSFLIPLLQVEWLTILFVTPQVRYSIIANTVFVRAIKPAANGQAYAGFIVAIIYFTGLLFFSARFIFQLIKLKILIDGEKQAGAFSFFGRIHVSEKLNNDRSVYLHELVHARQWHSLDVLLIEVTAIINWFNPIVYLYRPAIKYLHEYIADKQVLNAGIDRSTYSLTLVSQTFDAPIHQLVNSFFNKSLLKQRIIMLNKKPSRKTTLMRYSLVAPLFVLMLILSSATLIKHPSFWINGSNTEKGDKIYTTVEKAPEFPGGIDAFYKFLGENIRYPARMRENNIQGKVIVSFVVEKDGALSSFKVKRTIAKEASEETLRVFHASPKWKPGYNKGKPVRCQYTVPVAFTLEK